MTSVEGVAEGDVHTMLDVAGFIPVVGEAFDVVNGVMYLAEGDLVNGLISFAAIVPVAGAAVTGARLASKADNVLADALHVADDVPGASRSPLGSSPSNASGAPGARTATDEAFHYTSPEYAESISQTGLLPGSYATPNGSLSPLQAQLELALPPNRALPTGIVRIDVAGLRSAGYELPSVTRVSSMVTSGTRTYNMPGGGLQMQFPFRIPSEFLSVVP